MLVAIVVVVHEFGHYLAARLCGVIALEFSVGFGPTLVQRRDRRGTIWKFSLILLGGYVKFDNPSASPQRQGDQASDNGRGDGRSGLTESDGKRPVSGMYLLAGVPLRKRVVIVAAGPLASFLLAVVLFAGMFMLEGQVQSPPVVEHVKALPWEHTGLQPGDEILAINGEEVHEIWDIVTYGRNADLSELPIYTIVREGRTRRIEGPFPTPAIVAAVAPGSAASDAEIEIDDVILTVNDKDVLSFAQLQNAVEAAGDQSIQLEIWRQGRMLSKVLESRIQSFPDGEGGYVERRLIGVSMGLAFDPALRTPGPLEALDFGVRQTWSVAAGSLAAIGDSLFGQLGGCDVLHGPVGIARVSGEVAAQGIDRFLRLVAVLSVVIGLFNLFPIQPLDGGHLLFYAYEAATGKLPPPRVAAISTRIGIALIVFLLIFALYLDLTCDR